jgi:penicillin-binding protein 1A
MAQVLKGAPVKETKAPEGVISVGNDWIYEEYAHGAGVASLGLEAASAPAPPTEDERKGILDLFRN